MLTFPLLKRVEKGVFWSSLATMGVMVGRADVVPQLQPSSSSTQTLLNNFQSADSPKLKSCALDFCRLADVVFDARNHIPLDLGGPNRRQQPWKTVAGVSFTVRVCRCENLGLVRLLTVDANSLVVVAYPTVEMVDTRNGLCGEHCIRAPEGIKKAHASRYELASIVEGLRGLSS
jgi:hypothetical protein